MELIFDDRWLQVTDNTDHHAYAPQTANSKVLYSKVVGLSNRDF